MKTPKQTLDKLNEGCGLLLVKGTAKGNIFCGDDADDNEIFLCPECIARKNQFIEDCKNELEWMESNFPFNLKLHPESNPISDRKDDLEEVINSEEAEG